MKYAQIVDRLTGLGGEKWALNMRASELTRQGRDIINLTIGNPDVPTPTALIDTATAAMRAGRTQYSNGRGEEGVLGALSARYSARLGRDIGTDQFLCLPGTQTALYLALTGLTEPGTDVLVGDPMYATYEGVIAASGARIVPVPLRPENGFRIAADDIARRITPKSRAILLNTPHNPTGAVLTPDDIREIGDLAVRHDLWLIVDEVYEELVFDGVTFTSPLAFRDLADRVVVLSSISKSHAAPGFRSGWCLGSREFAERLLPLAETMLFGNQPFIADMTAAAISGLSATAMGMRHRFARRADLVVERLAKAPMLSVHRPDAGMFAMVNIAATGLSADAYARDLLERHSVAVMPGTSFGATLASWVRLALTVDDAVLALACDRIAAHANTLTPVGAQT